MADDLEKLKDLTAQQAFGMTKAEAVAQGLCIQCRQPPRFYSDAGRQEYRISGLCEYCFDEITKEPD